MLRVVTAEELRGQLGERLPGIFALAEEAVGVSCAAFEEFLAHGVVTYEELLPCLESLLEGSDDQ